jgi:UDP-N-acetylglucosamine acyltransferase
MAIHPTAIIEKGVELDSSVIVGPFSVLKGQIKIGRGTKIESHVVIGSEHGTVIIGQDNHIFSGAVIGGPPQDLKFKGENTRLEIGDRNIIREFVTLNVGTKTGGGLTKIGSDNLLMAYVHVAHDCHLGNHIVVANSSNFAGHVIVEDNVRIGGVCGFTQFTRIGRYSFIAYSIAQGKYAIPRAANEVGMQRAGFPKEEVDAVYRAIRMLTRGSGTVEEILGEIEQKCMPSEHVKYLIEFIRKAEKGIAR